MLYKVICTLEDFTSIEILRLFIRYSPRCMLVEVPNYDLELGVDYERDGSGGFPHGIEF
jgi:hypothetical protein